jgi:hypothetical protein
MLKKPPLGVMPEWLWIEQNPTPGAEALHARVDALAAATGRYRDADMPVPAEWLDEQQRLDEVQS